MKRQGPTTFDIPSDLWAAFEAHAPSTGALPHLHSVVKDIADRPHALVKTLDHLLRTKASRAQETVAKGVRWPKETWDSIETLSNMLHTTKVGVIRLAMEHDLHNT